MFAAVSHCLGVDVTAAMAAAIAVAALVATGVAVEKGVNRWGKRVIAYKAIAKMAVAKMAVAKTVEAKMAVALQVAPPCAHPLPLPTLRRPPEGSSLPDGRW